ncbi:hypothetical protein BH23VER1_BH23VER1_36290 [soil metagenome]
MATWEFAAATNKSVAVAPMRYLPSPGATPSPAQPLAEPMSLRDQLREILPELLPDSPGSAIKGTELISIVKFRLKQEYSDATLRYHFSIMCCDPSSPIAKVEQGQGYYLRSHALNSYGSRHPGGRTFFTPSQPSLGEGVFDQAPGLMDLAIVRALKFRAVFQRLAKASGHSTFNFDQAFSSDAPLHNVWKFPDIALVRWLVARADDEPGDQVRLDRPGFALRRAAGLPAFSIGTAKLKMDVTYAGFREDFFQALSHSAWASSGELAIAAPITDGQLADDLRALGSTYGIAVTTYGLAPEVIDSLPDPTQIRDLEGHALDALQSKLNIQKLAPAPEPPRPTDLTALERAASENPDARRLVQHLRVVTEAASTNP